MKVINGHTRLPKFTDLKARYDGTTPEWTWYFIASGALPPSELGDHPPRTLVASHGTEGRVMIAWGSEDFPTYDGVQRLFERYRVSRSIDGVEFKMIGETPAEFWLDTGLQCSTIYRYRVDAIDSNDIPHRIMSCQTVVTPGRRSLVATPPDSPYNYAIQPSSTGRTHTWDCCLDNMGERKLLAYIVEEDNSGQPSAIIWENSPVTSWEEPAPSRDERGFWLRSLDWDLQQSERSNLAIGTAGVEEVPVSGINLVPNPRLHINLDGWSTEPGWESGFERVTSVPFDLPDDADASARIDSHVWGQPSSYADFALPEDEIIPYTITFGGVPDDDQLVGYTDPWGRYQEDRPATHIYLYAHLIFYGESTALDSADLLQTTEPTLDGRLFAGVNQWHILTGQFHTPNRTRRARLYLYVISVDLAPEVDGFWSRGYFSSGEGYYTKLRIGGTAYGDGDSNGWAWDGTPHNSTSRSL